MSKRKSSSSLKSPKRHKLNDKVLDDKLESFTNYCNKILEERHSDDIIEILEDSFKKHSNSIDFDTFFIANFSILLNKSGYLVVRLIPVLRDKITKLVVKTLGKCCQLIFKKIQTIDETFESKFFDFCIEIVSKTDELATQNLKKEFLADELINLLNTKSLSEIGLTCLVTLLSQISITTFELINPVEFFDHIINLNTLKTFKKVSNLQKIFDAGLKISTNTNSMASNQIRLNVIQTILNFFHSISSTSYLGQKELYDKMEQYCFNGIINMFKLDSLSQEIYEIIENFIHEKISNDLNIKKFSIILCLYSTNITNENIRSGMNILLISTIEKLFDIEDKCYTHKWIERSLNQSSYLTKYLTKSLQLSNVEVLILDREQAVFSLIELSLNLIEIYNFKITKYSRPTNKEGKIVYFATNILLDLFKNCDESRDIIIESLLKGIEKHYIKNGDKTQVVTSTKYIDQLDLVFRELVKLKNLPIIAIKFLNNSIFSFNSSKISIKILDVVLSKKFFLKSIRSNGAKQLIDTFKASISDASSIDKRKISYHALISIIKALAVLVKGPSSDMDPIKPEDSEYCLELFYFLENIIIHETCPDIKYLVYKGFCKIISLNSGLLFEPVYKFMVNRIESFIQKTSTEVFINLAKCYIKDSNEFVEPIDILLHCGNVCLYKYYSLIKLANNTLVNNDNIKELIAKHEDILRSLTHTISISSGDYIRGIYKNQLSSFNAIKIKTIHQIELGVIELLLEYQFYCKNYKLTLTLFKKYSEISTLISNEIEELMSPSQQSTHTPQQSSKNLIQQRQSSSVKRKLSELYASGDKENQPSSSSSLFPTPNTPIRHITGRQSQIQQTPPRTPQVRAAKVKLNFSSLNFTSLKFTHIHRISYQRIMSIIENVLSSVGIVDSLNDSNDNDETFNNDIIDLICNEDFLSYINDIVKQKLNCLLDSENIYDPESFTQTEIINYLIDLWNIYWKRVFNVATRIELAYLGSNPLKFSSLYLAKILKYLKYLTSIWTIVSRDYQIKTSDLVGLKDLSDSIGLAGIINECQFGFSHFYETENNEQAITTKIQLFILNIIYEIVSLFNIDSNLNETLTRWFTRRLSLLQPKHYDIAKSIIRIIKILSFNNGSSLLDLKYYTIDLGNFLRKENENISTRALDESSFSQRNQFLSKENCDDFFTYLIQEQTSNMSLLEWYLVNIKFTTNNDSMVLKIFYKHIQTLSLILNTNLNSIYNKQNTKLMINHLTRFYSLLSLFVLKRLNDNMSFIELDLMKNTLILLSKNSQLFVVSFFGKIQKFMMKEELEVGVKMDLNEINELKEFKESMNNLFVTIDEFEEGLFDLDSKYKQEGLLKLYDQIIPKLQELKFKSKVTRTISEQQINRIIYE